MSEFVIYWLTLYTYVYMHMQCTHTKECVHTQRPAKNDKQHKFLSVGKKQRGFQDTIMVIFRADCT